MDIGSSDLTEPTNKSKPVEYELILAAFIETFCTLYVCKAVLQCSATFVLKSKGNLSV